MFSTSVITQMPRKPISVASLLLILTLSSCSCYGLDLPGSARRCGYKQVQQMFDWARFGPNGCMKLKSISFIFGDSQEAASPKLTAARFLTANLVFTGTIVHVIKDSSVSDGTAYKITVRVHCYLKGRLGSSEVVLSGFQADSTTGLCVSITCQEGETGLFFATYLNADDIRINENGYVQEGPDLDAALRVLRCRENHAEVNFWPVEGQAAPYCRQIDAVNEPTCQMSIDTARAYLGHAFINFEADLKPECLEGKDFVMRQIFLAPLSTSPEFSRLAGDGSGASRLRGHPFTGAATLAALVTALHLLSGGVFAM